MLGRSVPFVLLLLAACSSNDATRPLGSSSAITASASASSKPRRPELGEVANAPYYAAFQEVPWSEAAALIRAYRVLDAEENQAGRVYLTTLDAEDRIDKKLVTTVPEGVDLEAMGRAAKLATNSPRFFKHFQYEQITWTEAVALLRGERGKTVTSLSRVHFQRVFIRTSDDAEHLAIEPDGALKQVLDALPPEKKTFSFTVE